MRCMYNLFRVCWTNIEDRKILVLKALQDIFVDCQRCIETTSPWLDIAFPLSHPPVKLQIGPHVIAADEILKPPRIWLQWPQAVILSAPSMTRWAHHVQRSDEQSQDTSITKAFDNVEVVFSCCEDRCVRLNSLGPNKAQSLRIHVPSTSNRRSKTERCWLIWEEGVTVFRKYVCGFLLLVACLHSWLMLIPMLIYNFWFPIFSNSIPWFTMLIPALQWLDSWLPADLFLCSELGAFGSSQDIVPRAAQSGTSRIVDWPKRSVSCWRRIRLLLEDVFAYSKVL